MRTLLMYPFRLGLLLVLLALVSHAFGQRTYYKTATRTVYDLRMEYMESNDPYYKLGIIHGDSTRYFGPEEIREYGNRGGQVFISGQTPEGETVFMELLEDGPLKLLFLIDKDYNRRFFIRFMESDPTEIYAQSDREGYYREVLDRYWAFCEGNRTIIDQCDFKRGSLRRTVRGHNECTAVFFPKKRWEVQLGLSNNEAFFQPGSEGMGPMPEGAIRILRFWGSRGVQGHLMRWSPVAGGNLSLGYGLQLQAARLEDGVVFSFMSPFDRDFEVSFSLLDLGIPLGLRYTTAGTRFRPLVGTMLTPSYLVRNRWDIVESIKGDPAAGTQDLQNEYLERLAPFGWQLQLYVGAEVHTQPGRAVVFTGGVQRRQSMGKNRVFNFGSVFAMIGYNW